MTCDPKKKPAIAADFADSQAERIFIGWPQRRCPMLSTWRMAWRSPSKAKSMHSTTISRADWVGLQAVTCFEGKIGNHHQNQVATCSFCWIIWGTDWVIAPRLERNPRLWVITKASLRESCGEDGLKISWSGWWLKMVGILSFEMFWSMWDVSISNLHVLCCDCHLHGN